MCNNSKDFSKIQLTILTLCQPKQNIEALYSFLKKKNSSDLSCGKFLLFFIKNSDTLGYLLLNF